MDAEVLGHYEQVQPLLTLLDPGHGDGLNGWKFGTQKTEAKIAVPKSVAVIV